MDRDAYPDEMARFLRMSDADVERLFEGLAPEDDEDLKDLAGFLAEAATTLSRPPRSVVEADHLARLAASIRTPAALETAAQAPPSPPSTERRSPMRIPAVRWAAKVTVAAAGLVVMTGALAFAGVDLPGTAAETAFDKVFGLDLPNQADEHAGSVPDELPESAADTANAVLDVIRELRSGAEWTGCEFGAAVSAAARGETEPDTSHCEAADAGGSVAGAGSENADQGLEEADEASGGASSEGAGNADDGLEEADGASGGTSSGGAGNADEGLEEADGASGGAGSDGSANADEGLATAEEELDTGDEASDGFIPVAPR